MGHDLRSNKNSFAVYVISATYATARENKNFMLFSSVIAMLAFENKLKLLVPLL